MKRILFGIGATVVGVTLIGLGLAAFRPDLMPAWARPKAPATSEGTTDSGLQCKEHGIPEKFCTLCHEELKDKLMLCKEHGNIPEDICTLCHAELQKKHNIEMCPQGHGLPKHFCIKCGNIPSASTDAADDGWCSEHNRPEILCAECLVKAKGAEAGPARVCRQPLSVVRFASAKIAKQIGLKTALVTKERHSHKLSANAETAYDGNRYAEISPRVAGFIREVKVDLGRAIHQGDVLAIIDSSEVSAVKAQYLSAQASAKLAQVAAGRTQSLAKTGAVAGKAELEMMTALNQAQASVMDAEQKLRNLGFGDTELDHILTLKDTRNNLTVVSPIDGSLVFRHAVQGEAVSATTQLFTVADTSKIWLWIDVYDRDIAALAPGQTVNFSASGSDATHSGRVTWIGTEVNPTTRTTRIRAELENKGGRLRANQFGRAEIQIDAEHEAVMVPKLAVQRKDNADLVFLTDKEGTYRPQRITSRSVGRGDVVEVTWGLKPGQQVVTDGAFLLKTEVTKGAIGAGCCD
jgi:cobalt-zinc-cadmium efflux system membrane fusion protein